jgi:hypothetical protein
MTHFCRGLQNHHTIFFLQIISKPNEHHNIKETSGKRTDDLKRKNSLENNKSPVKKVKCRYDKKHD